MPLYFSCIYTSNDVLRFWGMRKRAVVLRRLAELCELEARGLLELALDSSHTRFNLLSTSAVALAGQRNRSIHYRNHIEQLA